MVGGDIELRKGKHIRDVPLQLLTKAVQKQSGPIIKMTALNPPVVLAEIKISFEERLFHIEIFLFFRASLYARYSIVTGRTTW